MRIRVLPIMVLPLALGACNLVLPELQWPTTGFSMWSLRLGGNGADVTWPDVATDPDGNVYVAGLFTGTVDFGGGAFTSPSRDIPSGFVLKLDRDGVHQWSKHVLAQGGISNVRVSARSGEVLVSAGFGGTLTLGSYLGGADDLRGHLLIARLGAADGSVLWAQDWSSDGPIRGGAILHPGGDVSVHGHFSGSSLSTLSAGSVDLLNANPSTDDLFAARLSSSGTRAWLRGFGDMAIQPASQQVYGTGTVDTSGSSVLMTNFSGALDLAGCIAPSGATAMFAKLNATGSCVHSVSFKPQGSGGQAALWYAAPTKGLGTVVAGALFGTVAMGESPVVSEGEADVFLVKVDAVGVVSVVKTFGDATYNEISGLAVDGSDNLYVASTGGGSIDFGGGALQSAGDQDVFVARLDPIGQHVWSRRFGDAREQVASALAVDPDGYVLIAGHFSGNINLGSGGMDAVGLHDVFVARLGP